MPLNTGPFNAGTFGVPLVPAPTPPPPPPPVTDPAPDPNPGTSLPASTANVTTINPVYSITPVVAVTPGPQPKAGSGTGTVAGSAAGGQLVTFLKATYTSGPHGGDLPSFPTSVTMPAIVAPMGVPVRVPERENTEPRPLARLTFKITVDEDPGALIGMPIVTDDEVVWGNLTLVVIGSPYPQASGKGFEVIAELIG
jgi:hypothetical protein